MPEDPVRPSVGCSYTSESMRIKVPDLVLTNLSGFLKLEDLGLSSGLESMLFFRFKSALNSLSFICSDMFILFDFCWRVMKRLTLIWEYTLIFYRLHLLKHPSGYIFNGPSRFFNRLKNGITPKICTADNDNTTDKVAAKVNFSSNYPPIILVQTKRISHLTVFYGVFYYCLAFSGITYWPKNKDCKIRRFAKNHAKWAFFLQSRNQT